MSWEALRKRAGLTLEEAAEATGYGISTINGLERRDEGSDRLKQKLRSFYEERLKIAESVVAPSPLAEVPASYRTSPISTLMSEIQRLKLDVAAVERAALAISERVSRDPVGDTAGEIVERANVHGHPKSAPKRRAESTTDKTAPPGRDAGRHP